MRGKFKKKSSSSSKIILLSFLIFILNVTYTTSLSKPNSVIFSDTSLAATQSLFSTNLSLIKDLLSNTTLYLYEADINSSPSNIDPNCLSLYSLIVTHSNYTLNSFETKNKYFQCEEILELFCNQQTTSKIIISHSLMDCEDTLRASNQTQTLTLTNPNDTTALTATTLISLSPSSSQIAECLNAVLSSFSITKYAIVFSDDDSHSSSYAQMASSLVYKLSKMKFSLEFSLGLSDTTLASYLSNSFNDSTSPGN